MILTVKITQGRWLLSWSLGVEPAYPVPPLPPWQPTLGFCHCDRTVTRPLKLKFCIYIYYIYIYIYFFFLILFIYLFIYGCVGSSFLCEGFLQLRQVGATLHCGARASPVAEHRLQTRRLSSCGSRALEHRLSSCGARAYLLRGMWDLPRPGLEPVSPALAGRFSTTAPPGKPKILYIFIAK